MLINRKYLNDVKLQHFNLDYINIFYDCIHDCIYDLGRYALKLNIKSRTPFIFGTFKEEISSSIIYRFTTNIELEQEKFFVKDPLFQEMVTEAELSMVDMVSSHISTFMMMCKSHVVENSIDDFNIKLVHSL